MTASVAGRRLRRVAVASVATMALFGLSACGGDDSDSKASDGSSSSSAAPSASSSSSASGGSEETGASGTPSTPAAGSEVSAADMAAIFANAFAKATSAHVTLASSGGSVGGITAEGDASYAKPIAVSMTMTLPQIGQAEFRLVDNVVYMKLPMLGDKFVKFPLDDPNSPLGSFGSTITSQLDPAQLTKSLEGAIDKATYVGQESVDGEQLDHYSLAVDSQKMLASYGSAIPSTGAGSAGLPKQLTYDLWFDGDGLFRQMKFDLGSAGSFTGTFSDWGKPVDVQAPPAAETTDMPSFPSADASG